MADWIGADGSTTVERYLQMAGEFAVVSPSYAEIARGVAADPELIRLLDTLPAPKRQPNLLLAAVRFVARSMLTWPAFRSCVLERWAEIAATMLARRTQTNEAGRCATLLPLLVALPQPLALLEVGASAGLCLLPDRYAYRYEQPALGRGTGRGRVLREVGSTVGAPTLRCVVDGRVPLPERLPDVTWRAGLDLNPLDLSDDEDVRWLRALIWPEQTRRHSTLSAAVDVARADPPRVVTGDLITDLGPLAAEAPRDATLVVFHSAVLAYVPAGPRSRFVAQVSALAAERPTVWLANEAAGIVVEDRVAAVSSSFVLARDGEAVARADGHGESLSWIG